MWESVASFQLVVTDSADETQGASEASSVLERCSWKVHDEGDEQIPQSRNPFAKNFVPPESLGAPLRRQDPPAPSSTVELSPSTSLILRLYVMGDTLISRELLGDVTIDLVALLGSSGSALEVDRIGHSKRTRQVSVPADELLAVDTWVALRKTSGELRIQILLKPASIAKDIGMSGVLTGHAGRISNFPFKLSRSPSRTDACNDKNTRSPFPATGNPSTCRMPYAHGSNVQQSRTRDDLRGIHFERRGASPIGVDSWDPPTRRVRSMSHAEHELREDARISSWSEFDEISSRGQVKVSVCMEHGTLGDRLLKVQQQYDFSAASGYREGRPDDESVPKGESVAKKREPPDWPGSPRDTAQLQRDMQYAAWRTRSQSIGENRTDTESILPMFAYQGSPIHLVAP